MEAGDDRIHVMTTSRLQLPPNLDTGCQPPPGAGTQTGSQLDRQTAGQLTRCPSQSSSAVVLDAGTELHTDFLARFFARTEAMAASSADGSGVGDVGTDVRLRWCCVTATGALDSCV